MNFLHTLALPLVVFASTDFQRQVIPTEPWPELLAEVSPEGKKGLSLLDLTDNNFEDQLPPSSALPALPVRLVGPDSAFEGRLEVEVQGGRNRHIPPPLLSKMLTAAPSQASGAPSA